MRNTLQIALLATALAGLTGSAALAQQGGTGGFAAPATTTPRPQQAGADLSDYITLYREDAESFSNYNNIRWADDRQSKYDAFLKSRAKALTDIDFSALSQQGKIDYILLRNHIRSSGAYNALAQRQLAEMNEILKVREVIVPLEQSRWRMEKLDAKAAAGRIATIPDIIKAARERLDRARDAKNKNEPIPENGTLLSPSAALRTSRALDSLSGALRSYAEYYDEFAPDFGWWCRKPLDDAYRTIGDLSRFLREEIAGIRGADNDPLVGDPIGRETLLEDLKGEVIPYSPEQLIAIGEEEFAWCEVEMKKAAAEMGFGDDWKAAIAKVKDNNVPPGGQTDYIAGLAKEAIGFVKDNDLVTVPPLCEDLWRIRMIGRDGQRSLPFAAYGPQTILVAYATSDMAHADKLMAMRGNNRHFTRIVIPHELIPGHHLQGFMADRVRPYRKMFGTPFFVEGWALYWEMKLWDMGWAKTPEDRVGMLFWRMHRCARILVSLKFHLGQMTPPEMIDFLVDRVGHERLNATAEVRRFIGGDYSPLYQCGYMIGGKQLRAMHKEAMAKGMTEKAFNDAVLSYGSIPMELVRAGILGTDIKPDGEAEWKFARER